MPGRLAPGGRKRGRPVQGWRKITAGLLRDSRDQRIESDELAAGTAPDLDAGGVVAP